jgi:hypothetical protein
MREGLSGMLELVFFLYQENKKKKTATRESPTRSRRKMQVGKRETANENTKTEARGAPKKFKKYTSGQRAAGKKVILLL